LDLQGSMYTFWFTLHMLIGLLLYHITCLPRLDWLAFGFETIQSRCTLALINGPFVPHNLIWVQGITVPLLKFQMAPRLKLLISCGSKKKEPRYTCLSEVKAWHSQRVWAEVLSPAPHLLHKGLLVSPIKWSCLLWVVCPVRMPIMTLDCGLWKDKRLVSALRLGPKISSRVCLWVLPRPCHLAQCWLSNQRLIVLSLSMQSLNSA
jgi:hypothetical protein